MRQTATVFVLPPPPPPLFVRPKTSSTPGRTRPTRARTSTPPSCRTSTQSSGNISTTPSLTSSRYRRPPPVPPVEPASSSLLSGFQNLQAMDERRTVKLGETYQNFAEAERRVIPIVSKCLDGMIVAAKAVDERKVRDNRRSRRVSEDRPSTALSSGPAPPPRIQPSWWSPSSLASTLPGTTPSRTSARI